MFELMRKVFVKKRRDSPELRAEELTEFAEIMGDWLSCGFESYHAGWRKRDERDVSQSIDGNKTNAASGSEGKSTQPASLPQELITSWLEQAVRDLAIPEAAANNPRFFGRALRGGSVFPVVFRLCWTRLLPSSPRYYPMHHLTLKRLV